jgi:hypothetical protein
MSEVERWRAEVAALTEQAAPPRRSRRGLLRLAGVAAVGGAGAALTGGRSADAASTALMTEVNNNTTANTTISAVAGTAFRANNLTTTGLGLSGTAKVNGTGVYGFVDDTADTQAYGVWGEIESAKGYALVGTGGAAQLLLEPNLVGGVPVTFGVRGGSLRANFTGLYYCLAGDALVGDTWRSVVDAESAGAYHPITPARVYDSRRALPGPQSVLATGASRTISVADGRNISTGAVNHTNVVPAGSTAIAYNLTIVNTVGTNGYLAVNEGGNTTVSASIINWSAPGLTLANSSVGKLNDTRQITIVCGGTSTSCHFIIDVVGYYR